MEKSRCGADRPRIDISTWTSPANCESYNTSRRGNADSMSIQIKRRWPLAAVARSVGERRKNSWFRRSASPINASCSRIDAAFPNRAGKGFDAVAPVSGRLVVRLDEPSRLTSMTSSLYTASKRSLSGWVSSK